jgi:hypothetical protein
MAQALTDRDGMEFTGSEVEFTMGVGGKTIEDAKEFCNLMWGGPQKGDIAILHNGVYYACDGVDPNIGTPFTNPQLKEIVNFFGEENVTFL